MEAAPDASLMQEVSAPPQMHEKCTMKTRLRLWSNSIRLRSVLGHRKRVFGPEPVETGSNVAEADRFDQMAIDGLEKLTDSKGHVVLRERGIRDIANVTDDWHVFNASTLLTADLLPAIGDGAGHLDMQRISALGNVTEDVSFTAWVSTKG